HTHTHTHSLATGFFSLYHICARAHARERRVFLATMQGKPLSSLPSAKRRLPYVKPQVEVIEAEACKPVAASGAVQRKNNSLMHSINNITKH
ncbi:MAG: hypothetical protein II934_07085, partial [Prevotella sp.]|nr:hypothetical protein [Prevotella sp.]